MQQPEQPAFHQQPNGNVHVKLHESGIMLRESSILPGAQVLHRSIEEKSANPDRINADSCSLTACPLLDDEPNLRLLTMKHNAIAEISHLSALRGLIFLDLYDNQLTVRCARLYPLHAHTTTLPFCSLADPPARLLAI